MQATQRSDLDLTEVFARDYPRLCRVAALMVGSRALAEELVMDAFERTLRLSPTSIDPERAGAYLRRAVVNQARNAMRRMGNERRALARVAGLARRSAPGADVGTDDHPVTAAVLVLPPRQRAAVVLRYYADLSDAEIADALECSIGTVKSQLAKARARLARVLDDGGVNS